ncbi:MULTISPECIES: hypothetical protein [Streptomyces]|uniref:Sortase n=1 Tax=Streptomyces morookaense TaxID=1970 RepID=A0A7Y7B530_STRMO|nr:MULTISPECIES: hypothetical protein [Streptomyces]MCC2278349.1 hypothetical protein [Streptomyces sp. ET3-23]NVK79030.1 hypothetical protein [Streptomyces morookaense]GHF09821.1 hypothetical protein GCM10010359_09100 [Streptomyces morookaense]
MRTARVLAGTAGTALAITALPAFAGDFGKLEVTPGTVQPGAEVTVNTTACGSKGQGTGDASAVGGPASFDLKPGTHKEVVVGQFMVPKNAKPGTYGIGAKCANGKEATGDLVVTAGSSAPSGSPSAAASSMPMPSMSAAKPPKGGMKTGVGGTSEESGTADIVAGAALMAMAAAGGVWFLRRRGTGSRY